MSAAATRDASWYSHPNVTGAKSVHVDSGHGVAACNKHLPLGSTRWEHAADVPERLRCKRLACAGAFPTPTEEADHG